MDGSAKKAILIGYSPQKLTPQFGGLEDSFPFQRGMLYFSGESHYPSDPQCFWCNVTFKEGIIRTLVCSRSIFWLRKVYSIR